MWHLCHPVGHSQLLCHGAGQDGDGRTVLSQMKAHMRRGRACPIMCLCGRGPGCDASGAACKAHVEMEDNAIPEEYFTCHGDKLFDLLASALVNFAKRHGRCAPSCLRLPDDSHHSLENS